MTSPTWTSTLRRRSTSDWVVTRPRRRLHRLGHRGHASERGPRRAAWAWSAGTRPNGGPRSRSTCGHDGFLRPNLSGHPSRSPRRGQPMKRYRVREEMNGIPEPPGKVWFWELEAGVIHADRCIECGTCVAVCPSNSIGVDPDTNLPELVKMCTGCSLCWDFCPRGGLRYEALWPPSTATPGEEADVQPAQVRADSSDTYWKITGGPPEDGLGAVVESFAVRASACMDDVQDGGAVSACSSGSWPWERLTAPWSQNRVAIPTNNGRASPPSPPRLTNSCRLGQFLQPDDGAGRT